MGVILYPLIMELPERLASMLAGDEGLTRQKAARLVVDLAKTAGSDGFVNVLDVVIMANILVGGLP